MRQNIDFSLAADFLELIHQLPDGDPKATSDFLKRLTSVVKQIRAEVSSSDDIVSPWRTLDFVMRHLTKGAAQSFTNNMTAANLAICLAPCHFPEDSKPLEAAKVRSI